jgi:hypothetical protein
MEDVLANPNKPWDYEMLSRNQNITLKDILANRQIPWNYKALSWKNPNITMEIVLAYPEIPWDYKVLSLNTSITLDDVLANPDKPWAYDHLSYNRFGIPKHKGIVAMERESKARTVARTEVFKEELMMGVLES